MHFYAWKKGLKTGMYYLRTKAAADAIKFTVSQPEAVPKAPTPTPDEQSVPVCNLEPGCLTCSG